MGQIMDYSQSALHRFIWQDKGRRKRGAVQGNSWMNKLQKTYV